MADIQDKIYQDMNNKNFQSLSTGLKQVRKENTVTLERVNSLEETIVQLQQQLQIVQSQNAVVMSQAFGSGPTG